MCCTPAVTMLLCATFPINEILFCEKRRCEFEVDREGRIHRCSVVLDEIIVDFGVHCIDPMKDIVFDKSDFSRTKSVSAQQVAHLVHLLDSKRL